MRTLVGFFKKEFIALIRDPVLTVAVLVMPAVQLVVLSGAITMQANNLRLAADIAPNDTVMSRVYDHAVGAGWFVRAADTAKDPVRAVQSRTADAAIIADTGGASRGVVRPGGAPVQLLIDATNILKAQSIEAYMRGALQSAMQEIADIIPAAPPIDFNVRILFNPQLNTKWFMVPSMIAVLVFLSLLILITISITKEKENGTIETLMSAPISKRDIILGKVLPYIAVAFVVMLSILLIGMIWFGIPFAGSGLMFILGFLVFSFPASGIAVLLSNYTRTQQQALLGVVIVAFLSLMLSGALFPTENMPRLLHHISYVNPLSHYAYMVRDIMLKGPSWAYFARHAAMMFAAGVVVWFFAVRTFKTTL